jgi:type II secretory pathway component PulC
MHLARPASLALVTFATFALSACGASPPRDATHAKAEAGADAKAEPTAAPTTTAAVAERTTKLTRSQVRGLIRSGLGVFFQNVALEDYPVMRNNKFYGFKIRAMNPQWTVDLRPGDVVTRVNGMPIEHPEEADAAMRTLDKAPALRVDYERAGQAGVLELPIVDDAK